MEVYQRSFHTTATCTTVTTLTVRYNTQVVSFKLKQVPWIAILRPNSTWMQVVNEVNVIVCQRICKSIFHRSWNRPEYQRKLWSMGDYVRWIREFSGNQPSVFATHLLERDHYPGWIQWNNTQKVAEQTPLYWRKSVYQQDTLHPCTRTRPCRTTSRQYDKVHRQLDHSLDTAYECPSGFQESMCCCRILSGIWTCRMPRPPPMKKDSANELTGRSSYHHSAWRNRVSKRRN